MGAYDYLFKVVLIGDSGVGKSCLLQRFAQGTFNTEFVCTIGVDFSIRTMEINGKAVKLQVWDTAGQERFRTITSAYYRGVQGVVILYDVTSPRSFEDAGMWLREVEKHTYGTTQKMLVGCKTDLKAAVSASQAKEFAQEHGMGFTECSAKTTDNVTEVFHELAKNMLVAAEAKKAAEAENTTGSTTQAMALQEAKPISKWTCC